MSKKIHELPEATSEQIVDETNLEFLGDPTTGQLYKTPRVSRGYFFNNGIKNQTYPVRAATTSAADLNDFTWYGTYLYAASGDIFGTGNQLDGIYLDLWDEVLLKDMGDPLQNGVYNLILSEGNYGLQRVRSLDEDSEVYPLTVYVKEGTLNAGKYFEQATDSPTINTSDLVFNEVVPTSFTQQLGGDLIHDTTIYSNDKTFMVRSATLAGQILNGGKVRTLALDDPDNPRSVYMYALNYNSVNGTEGWVQAGENFAFMAVYDLSNDFNDGDGTLNITKGYMRFGGKHGLCVEHVSANASATPIASSIFTCESTSKGMLPPRMTTTQKNAITSPAEGLMVYDLTLHKLQVYDGSTWQSAW